MNNKQFTINEIYNFFFKYVDENKHLINRDNPNLEIVCDFSEIEKSTIFSSYALKEELTKKLKEIIMTNTQMKRNLLRSLEKHIILKCEIDRIDAFPYFSIINILNNRLQNGILICDITDREVWTKVIRICIGILNYAEEYEIDFYNELNIKEDIFRMVKSAKYLIGYGYKLEVSNGYISIDKNTEKNIASNIENLIIELGGENVTRETFNNLENVFNSEQKRYMLTRNATTLPNKDESQLMPTNYLLQLCFKHIFDWNRKKTNKIKYNKKLKMLNNLLLAFTGIFNFQKSSVFSDMFIEVESLPIYVQENIFFDKLFTFRQWNPDYIPELTIGLFKEIYQQYIDNCSIGYLFEDYLQLERELLTNEYVNFNVFTKEKLCKRLKLTNEESLDILLNRLSHKRSEINKDFLTFDSPIDFNQKPLIKITNKKYLLINPSLCAYAFIEVIERDLRKIVGDKFDSILGDYLEAYAKSCLKRKGINYKTGFYSDNSQCDIVIETDDKVVFIEVKKKPLTQKAQNGNDINFFNDVAKSLLASQVQLGGHELYLLQNGSISLRNYRSKKDSKGLPAEQIVYNNRNIERVSLVLQDYGFLNSKIIATSIMTLLTGVDIDTVDPTIAHELDDLKSKLKILLEQSEKIIEAGKKDRVKDIYFDVSFRSFQQFLLALDNSTSVENFVNLLLIDKYVTTGSYDFYKDFKYLCNIKR